MSRPPLKRRVEARSQPQRRYELDWLRVFAVFGLIPFHVAIIFSLGQKDYIANAQSSEVLDLLAVFVTFWGIPLLFLVAGAGAWFALGSRTPKQYVKQRVARLAVPLIFGVLTVVPIQVYFGRLTDPAFHQSFPKFYLSYFLAFSPTNTSTYLAHLWFIPVLLTFSLLTLPLFVYLRGDAGRRLVARLAAACDRPGVILLFGLPLGVSEAVLNVNPVTTLLTTYLFYSNWALFVYFLIFFIYGYAVYADARFERAIRRHAAIAIALGVVCWIAAQQLLTPYMRMNSSQSGFDLTASFVLAMFLRGFISWFWIVAIAGLAMRWLAFTNRLLEYLKDAFYPVYVLHMPVLTIVGFFVVQWPVEIAVKYVAIVVATLAITLVLYEVAIKHIGVSRALFGLNAAPPAARHDAPHRHRAVLHANPLLAGWRPTASVPHLLRLDRRGKGKGDAR